MMLALLLACAPAPHLDDRTYPRALHAVKANPAAAASACAAVRDAELYADCITAGAEALAKGDAAQAAKLCEGLPAGPGRDECHFQVAERSGDPTRCAKAGAFAFDCRMHAWTAALMRELSPGTRPGQAEAVWAERFEKFGFAPDDPRPWIAYYRTVLSWERPLDRSTCAEAGSPSRVDACRRAGLQLYSDRLNHARDTRTFPCDGGALTGALAYVDDAELEALVIRRRREDLCP